MSRKAEQPNSPAFDAMADSWGRAISGIDKALERYTDIRTPVQSVSAKQERELVQASMAATLADVTAKPLGLKPQPLVASLFPGEQLVVTDFPAEGVYI